MPETITTTRHTPDPRARRHEFFRADDGTPWVRRVYDLKRADGTVETVNVSSSLATLIAAAVITTNQRNGLAAIGAAIETYDVAQKGWGTP